MRFQWAGWHYRSRDLWLTDSIEVNFGAWPTWAYVRHFPEVFFRSEWQNTELTSPAHIKRQSKAARGDAHHQTRQHTQGNKPLSQHMCAKHCGAFSKKTSPTTPDPITQLTDPRGDILAKIASPPNPEDSWGTLSRPQSTSRKVYSTQRTPTPKN